MPFLPLSLLEDKRNENPHSSDLEVNLKCCQWDFFNTSTNLGRLILNFNHYNQTVLLL